VDAEWKAFESALPRGAPQGTGPRDARLVVVADPTGDIDRSLEPLRAAFRALGADWGDVRVVPARASGARLLLWEVEIVDPELVLVLGDEAARLAAEAWPCAGRPVVVLPDPALAIKTEKGKRDLWERLKPLATRLAPGR
jgi:hypothetical protein